MRLGIVREACASKEPAVLKAVVRAWLVVLCASAGVWFLVGLEGSVFTHAEPVVDSLAKPLKQQKASHVRGLTGAEVLLRRSHIVVDDDFLPTAQVYLSVAINDGEAARDYSQITIPYNEYYETLTLDFARVLSERGGLETIKPDAIQIQSPAQDNFYQDRKELTFSLPNVRAGSIIEFQYTRRDTAAIMPGAYFARFWLHWWQGKAGGQSSRLDPVIRREVTLETPRNMTLNVHVSEPSLIAQSVTQSKTHKRWHWSAKKLGAIALQAYMPREDGIVPYVSVSTAAGWQAVAHWADALFEPHIVLDDALRQQIAGIEKNATGHDDKVKAVYGLINDQIRYVFAHVGRGGYEPHSADAVYKNGYGDCKDQTVLAVAILRALGVKAYPALVATRSMGRPDMPLPSVHFDHMITYIPAQAGSDAIWLDTSGDNQLYPGGGVGLEGQPALIIRPSTTALTEIPNKGADQHKAHLQLAFQPPSKTGGQGGSLTADFTLRLTGIYEQSLRSTWMYQAEKEKAIVDSLANLFGNAELTQLAINNADNVWQPFEVSGVWVFKAPWSAREPESIAFNVSQLLGVFAGVYQWHKPDERLQPFQVDPGFVLEASVLFGKLGSDYQELISVGPNVSTPWFNLRQGSTKTDQGIEVNAQLSIPTLTLDGDGYAAFYRAINGLLDEQGFLVAYNIADNGARASVGKSDSAADSLFVEIRRHIADGQFASALTAARAAAKLNPESGEAQYLLGLAQGYNELLDEALMSFDLAKRLGYEQP
ncbi:MAG TPA: DUF3857 and transglutaminase domain-containing protein [Marinagarivorans sp.]